MKRIVYANYDEEGVIVYQAFKPEIVKVAVDKGTFGKGFGFERTSWIKPSFAWTLRRSNFATKNRMQAIAQIKITHSAFIEILSQSVETHYNPEVFQSELEWKDEFDKSKVIHQWDPERDLTGRKLERQAIQIGLRQEILKDYVDKYIIDVQDVTHIAHEIGEVVKSKKGSFPEVPLEKEYDLNTELFSKLGCNK